MPPCPKVSFTNNKVKLGVMLADGHHVVAKNPLLTFNTVSLLAKYAMNHWMDVNET